VFNGGITQQVVIVSVISASPKSKLEVHFYVNPVNHESSLIKTDFHLVDGHDRFEREIKSQINSSLEPIMRKIPTIRMHILPKNDAEAKT
jgi:hypothetical protein